MNHGYNHELENSHKSPDDYIFGAFSPICIATIPESERLSYLPDGELQYGQEDVKDCATRAAINKLETKFNWLYKNKKLAPTNELWLKENGYVTKNGRVEFSDAYIAIKSGTTRQGNSLKAPLQAINDWGLIPKKDMPLESWMTFSDYHDMRRITKRLENLGREFDRRFPIHYERVFEKHFEEVYRDDMIIEAGYAWPEPVNGEYPHVDDPLNHAFLGVSNPKHVIFDNYIDSVDDDFIKKLASDYNLLEYGYRIYITENIIPRRRTFYELIKYILHL